MKKILIVVNLMIIAFAMSGCGCNKKNKILQCTSELDEYNEKKYVEAKFEDDYLVSQSIETTTVFDSEINATRFYEMYKDSDMYETSINGLEVTLKQNADNSSTDDIFKYDNFYNSMIENNFKCKKK